MSTSYRVYERFHSWQGEGAHMGRSAAFIRLYGCPLRCAYCDSAGTWHPNYVPDFVASESAEALAQWALGTKAPMVVITGGEPAMVDLTALCLALHEVGLRVHLETSGAFPLRGQFDWVTVSPKRAREPLAQVLAAAHELKLIIEEPSDIAFWCERLQGLVPKTSAVWLNPEWSHHRDVSVLDAITQWVKTHGDPFRAGLQGHKFYRADEQDKGSARAVPLGGDPSRGY